MSLNQLDGLVRPPSGTFLNVDPAGGDDKAHIVVLGVPFDIGTHPHRVGSRRGPDQVRFASTELRPNLVELSGDPFTALNIVDAGNVALTPARVDSAFAAIESASRAILATGAVPLTIGGDGAVTLPQLRAAADRFGAGELAVIHLDAHTDAWVGSPDERYTNATTFVRAVEEGLIDPSQCVHIGVRGTSPVLDPIGDARDMGFEVITTAALRQLGVTAVAGELAARFAGRPVYVCWDMDIFDPAVAPGVCTPEWGGLSASEGIDFIRALTGIHAVTVDLNTVSPPHDPEGVTSSLAARLLLEFVYLIAAAHELDPQPTPEDE